MLDVRRNLHDIADRKAPRRLAFLLIPSLARDADEDLLAALRASNESDLRAAGTQVIGQRCIEPIVGDDLLDFRKPCDPLKIIASDLRMIRRHNDMASLMN